MQVNVISKGVVLPRMKDGLDVCLDYYYLSLHTGYSYEGSKGGRIFAPEVVNPKDLNSMGLINDCIVLDGHGTEPALDQWKHVIYWPLQLTCATH